MVYWKLPFMLTRKEVPRQVSGLDVWWTLRALIDYGCRAPVERLHGYKALTERLHSQSLDRLSADAEPTDAEPKSYMQQKTPRVKPEPQSNPDQSNAACTSQVVKLEPSVGPT